MTCEKNQVAQPGRIMSKVGANRVEFPMRNFYDCNVSQGPEKSGLWSLRISSWSWKHLKVFMAKTWAHPLMTHTSLIAARLEFSCAKCGPKLKIITSSLGLPNPHGSVVETTDRPALADHTHRHGPHWWAQTGRSRAQVSQLMEKLVNQFWKSSNWGRKSLQDPTHQLWDFPQNASGWSLSINERPMMPCVSALGVEAPMDEVGSLASCWHPKNANYGRTRTGMM